MMMNDDIVPAAGLTRLASLARLARLVGMVLVLAPLLSSSSVVVADASPATDDDTLELTVTWSFDSDLTFSIGEFAARLEACVSPSASVAVKSECAYWLASRDFDCRGEGSNATCVVRGVHVPVSAMSFSCLGPCPSEDASLASVLPTTAVDDCALASRPGFVDACYSSARCQWLSETEVVSFGAFCPDADGAYCCAEGAKKDETAFPGVLTTSTIVDYMERLSHVADLSFRVHYDVLPPSLVRVTVDAPYVTSESEMTTIVNGVQNNYPMCPSAYMLDFEDPVEPLPRAEDGYFRRASTQSQWSPLHFYPASDLLGRPRTPCGTFDFEYASADDFRTNFDFPDLLGVSNASSGSFQYGPTPSVDPYAWSGLEGVVGVPRENDTFWKIGTPVDGRVNYTTGYWDLVSGFKRCRDHQTGTSLVNVEHEGETYVGGVAYAVESYSWTLHLCQVGYFGPNCRDTSTIQSYAKTCATIPSTFSIAPRQVSHVDTTPTSSGLVSKSFLRSVSSVRGGCPLGNERVVLSFALLLFESEYVVSFGPAHAVRRPSGIFEGGQDGVPMIDASLHASTSVFLASDPSVEGMYLLKPFASPHTTGSPSDTATHHTIAIVTKCHDTGHDPVARTRSRSDAFAKAASDGSGRVYFELVISLDKMIETHAVKNSLSVRVLGTEDTFVLRDVDTMEQKGVRASHALYANYETAAADVSPSFPNALPSTDVTMFAGDQLCSKQQLAEGDAHGTALRPNAVGACVLSAKGETATDGDGVPVAGREIFYLAAGMPEPVSYVFGCFRDWIDVSTTRPTVAGVYEMVVLNRLPDENHESVFWFVARGALAETTLPGTGTTISDRFGTGLFAYDESVNDGAGSNVGDVSSTMQRDPLTASTPSNELTAGCAETAGNLRAACNLACFDVEEGLLTSTVVGDNKTLVVHHVSVATVANAAETASRHRFGSGSGSGSASERRRGLLVAANSKGGAGGGVDAMARASVDDTKTRSRARKIRVVARERHGDGSGGSGGSGGSQKNENDDDGLAWTIAWTVIGCAIVVTFGVSVCACANACRESATIRGGRKKKRWRGGGR